MKRLLFIAAVLVFAAAWLAVAYGTGMSLWKELPSAEATHEGATDTLRSMMSDLAAREDQLIKDREELHARTVELMGLQKETEVIIDRLRGVVFLPDGGTR